MDKLKSLLRNPWFWAFVIGIVSIHIIRPFFRYVPEPPLVYGTLPEYMLVNQDGRQFGSKDLKGEVYVANLFFTSCPSFCPAHMRRAVELQKKYEENKINVKLVAISIDPERDSPEVLKKYAENIGADLDRWAFLTGPRDKIKDLAINGFRAYMGEKEKISEDLYDIAHNTKFMLVDREGRIRGYYNDDELGLDEVFHRSQHVMHEKKIEQKE